MDNENAIMTNEELEFMKEILFSASWLFYGELDEWFDGFLCKVFSRDFSDYGFGEVPMTEDFSVAYWLLVSELNKLELIEYGTSPRGAWFIEKGKRFRDIVLKYKNAIEQTNDYIYKETH